MSTGTDAAAKQKRIIEPWAGALFILGMLVLVGSQVWLNSRTGPAVRAAGPVRVVVSIPALAWVVEEMAPEGAEVTVLARPGAGCHAVEPTPGQVAEIRRADVVVVAGAGIDDAVALVPVGAGAPAIEIVSLEARTAAQAGGTREGDPHRWLDPVVMESFAGAVRDAVSAAVLRAGGSAADLSRVSEGSERIAAECRRINEAYESALAPRRGAGLVLDHTAGSWLAERYGLRIALVLRDSHDAEPTPAALAEAARLLRDGGAGALVIEVGHPASGVVQLAESAGVSVIGLELIGDGDWPAMMERNLARLIAGLPERPDEDAEEPG